MTESLKLFALSSLPLIAEGDDLPALILVACELENFVLADGDIVVVAQKIVSKAEGRFVALASIKPSAAAVELAGRVEKDPRFVEIVLAQSRRVVRARPNLLIVEHRDGYIMANAGIDQSNIGPDGDTRVLLLPENSDTSAAVLRARLEASTGSRLAVVINDSFGRPWRRGTVGVALGAAGVPSLVDLRGQPDIFGRTLRVSEIGFADEIASAASLLMGQAAERRPVVIMRGLNNRSAPDSPAAALIRPAEQDLFR